MRKGEYIVSENVELMLERHEQYLKMMQKDIDVLKEVQSEIKVMNETLVTFATELKHTNENLARHEKKLDELDEQPRARMEQIVTAIIAALSGGIITTIIGLVMR